MIRMAVLNSFDKLHKYRIISECLGDVLHLTIIHELSAFKCQITHEDVNDFAKSFEWNVREYFNVLQDYLGSASPDISVKIKDCKFEVYNKSSIKFFNIKVQQADYSEVVDSFFDQLYGSNQSLNDKITTLSDEKEQLVCENNLYSVKLQEHEIDSTRHEKELYSSFLLLLNEKKAKIRQLTNLLEGRGIGCGDETSPPSPKRKRFDYDDSTEDESRHELSDSDSVQIDTKPRQPESISDDEDDPEPGPSARVPLHLPPRRTHKNEETEPKKPSPKTQKPNNEKIVIESKNDAKKESDPDSMIFTTQDLLDRL